MKNILQILGRLIVFLIVFLGFALLLNLTELKDLTIGAIASAIAVHTDYLIGFLINKE
jgi:hypothetical protein